MNGVEVASMSLVAFADLPLEAAAFMKENVFLFLFSRREENRAS